MSKDFYIIAHNIRSLYNVGSIFRTADAFGVTKIFLTGYTGTPGNFVQAKRISKSALGAEKWVNWEYHKSALKLIKQLKQAKVNIVGLDNNIPAGAGNIRFCNIKKFRAKFPLALILGEEVRGVSKPMLKLCDQIVEIPMLGKKESLNVSVALGVAAYCIKFN